MIDTANTTFQASTTTCVRYLSEYVYVHIYISINDMGYTEQDIVIYTEPGFLPSARIKIATLGLLDPRSNQLSYEGYHYYSILHKYKHIMIMTS